MIDHRTGWSEHFVSERLRRDSGLGFVGRGSSNIDIAQKTPIMDVTWEKMCGIEDTLTVLDGDIVLIRGLHAQNSAFQNSQGY